MKAKITHGMSLQQPWARLVAEGVFPVLIRQIPTRIRGRVAVVARGYDRLALVDGREPDENEFPQSVVVGYVEISGCEAIQLTEILARLETAGGKRFVEFYPKHHLPTRPPAYMWTLRNPTTLPKPMKLPQSRARTWIRLG